MRNIVFELCKKFENNLPFSWIHRIANFLDYWFNFESFNNSWNGFLHFLFPNRLYIQCTLYTVYMYMCTLYTCVHVYVISCDPSFIEGMPESQRYPLNLFLFKDKWDILEFLAENWLVKVSFGLMKCRQ